MPMLTFLLRLCLIGFGPSPATEPLPACPAFAEPVVTGRVKSGKPIEISGVVESRRNPGVLWVHNDSGDSARLFALNAKGKLMATFELAGATNVDWEDLAIGPGPVPGKSYLYIGDIGDNPENRPYLVIYRVLEPEVPHKHRDHKILLSDVQAIRIKYPDGTHNSESLFLDPLNGDIYLVAKAFSGSSPIYRARAPFDPSKVTPLEKVTTLRFGHAPLSGDPLTTAADVSPDGSLIAIRTYTAGYVWRRAPDTTIAQALATQPCPLPLVPDGQGEALGFSARGDGFYTVSEGKKAPIRFYKRK